MLALLDSGLSVYSRKYDRRSLRIIWHSAAIVRLLESPKPAGKPDTSTSQLSYDLVTVNLPATDFQPSSTDSMIAACGMMLDSCWQAEGRLGNGYSRGTGIVALFGMNHDLATGRLLDLWRFPGAT